MPRLNSHSRHSILAPQRILAFGELLWDVFAEAEFLGGAPLNFSAATQRLGNAVTLISGVGEDARGQRAIESAAALGLNTELIRTTPGRDTGTAKITTDGHGNASYFIQRPAAFDDLALDEAQLSALEKIRPDWMYFGTLSQADQGNEDLVRRLVQRLSGVRCFYDMNLRDGHWNLPLVQRLSALASIVKLNEEEAEILFRLSSGSEEFSLEKFCRHWSATYDVDTICITLGGQGCAIFHQDTLQLFGGFPIKVMDTVGAGDAFAAAFLHGHIQGWPISQQASFANGVGALVASRAGATPAWTVDECLRLIAASPELKSR